MRKKPLHERFRRFAFEFPVSENILVSIDGRERSMHSILLDWADEIEHDYILRPDIGEPDSFDKLIEDMFNQHNTRGMKCVWEWISRIKALVKEQEGRA